MHFWHMCVLLRTSACTLLYTLSTLMFMPCTHALHDFQSRLLYFSYTAFRLVIRNLEATVVCLLYDCSATGNRILRDLSPGGIPDESQVFQTTASARNRQARVLEQFKQRSSATGRSSNLPLVWYSCR